MKKDDMELMRGSGNVYCDFGRPNAGLEQARAIIAAKIIKVLDERKLSTREAEKLTGVSHSEFTRIRNAQLRRFTLDRMIAILGKAFHRSDVSLFSVETPDGLLIDISYLGKGGAFLLYNTHSLPLPWFLVPAYLDRWRQFGTSSDTFKISYGQILREPISRDVLSEQIPTKTVQPNHHVSDLWQAPFFFEDRRNTFYVTTEEQLVWVPNFQDFGISINPGVAKQPQIPPLVVQPSSVPRPSPWPDGGPIGPAANIVDPAPMERFVTEDAYIRQGLGTTIAIAFGDRHARSVGCNRQCPHRN